MTRATAVRAVLAVAVLLVSVYISLTMSPRLGLDLQGGTRIVLQARDTATVEADRETTDRTLEVLRQRIDSLGVSEPTLTRSGEDRIIVELPDVQDPRQAAEVIGRTAQLTFHAVEGPAVEKPDEKPSGSDPTADPSPTADTADPDGLTLSDEQGRALDLGPARLSGAGVEDATAGFDAQGGAGWSVSLEFRKDSRPGLEAADRRGRLPSRRGRPPEGRHRPRREGHLLAAGRPLGRLQGRTPVRGHPDHRLVQRGRSA